MKGTVEKMTKINSRMMNTVCHWNIFNFLHSIPFMTLQNILTANF